VVDIAAITVGEMNTVHRGFVNALDANVYVLSQNVSGNTTIGQVASGFRAGVPHHDIYIAEHANALFTAPRLIRANPEATILLLAAERFEQHRYNFSRQSQPVRAIRRADRSLHSTLIKYLVRRYVDGVIAVSEYIEDWIHSVDDTIQTRIVRPYIAEEDYRRLSTLEPSLSNHRVVCVCTWRDHKGADLLVDAWPSVRAELPDAELHLIGSGHPYCYSKMEGVVIRGYVEDLVSEYERASLYVHPARMDGFPISTLEALRAGVPVAVTGETGTRSVIANLDSDYIVSPRPDTLADVILAHFDTSQGFRTELSERARALGSQFRETNQKRAFQDAVASLM